MAKAPRGKGRAKKGAGFEVEESGDAAAGQAAGIESGLVVVTFVALIVALLLSQIELADSFGKGLFGG
jgi:hypothetical protein